MRAGAERKYDWDEAERLFFEENLSCVEIGRRMGVTERTIQRLVAPKRGYKPYRRMSPADLALAEQMLNERTGYREVAKTLGFEQKTIARHFPGMGLTPEEAGERAMLSHRFRRMNGD